MTMARREGWATAPLEAAYEACLADNLELRLESKPKASPDRRHHAHISYTIDGNGDGWTTLYVHNRHGELVHQSEPFDSTAEAATCAKLARSLRWLDRRTVEVGMWLGPVAPRRGFPTGYRVEIPEAPVHAQGERREP